MNQKFNKVWESFASSTWKACLRFTNNNHHDAEDLMQTTWLKAYMSWRKKPKSLTKTYFTTIAKNTWIDESRKGSCQPFRTKTTVSNSGILLK